MHELNRKTFTSSRLAEFASEAELVRQTGHASDQWAWVIVKEAIDNALDACEEAGIAPLVEVEITDDAIIIGDYGPGIAPETVAAIVDYDSKTSSREAYVSPTRGQQGNALQTILAMPYALTGVSGETIIESHGTLQRITFSVDPLRQTPTVTRTTEPSDIDQGTRITVSWPGAVDVVALADAVRRYAWFNPHLTLDFKADRNGEESDIYEDARDTSWSKWLPKNQTSPHWYDVARLKNLIAKTVAHAIDNDEQCPTVAAFIADFADLAGNEKRKRVCAELDVKGLPLSVYIDGGYDVKKLLAVMQANSREIKPRNLGLIGKESLREKFEHIGDVEIETFQYRKAEIIDDGVPYLIEAAFAYCPGPSTCSIITGLNWSITVGQHPFRDFGNGSGLDGLLSDQWVDPDDPVIFFLHISSPRLAFLDKGKSSINLPRRVGWVVRDVANAVTDKWAKQRRQEDRDASAEANRLARLIGKREEVTIKDAAYAVMAQAYMDVSDNNILPANARQIMYAARPEIFKMTTRKKKMSDAYFTQTLLVDYMNEHPDECANWNVVWSDRGHFKEPHSNKLIGLGTLAIRDYIGKYAEPSFKEPGFKEAKIKTHGPRGRYCGLLYIEKEGFDPLLDAAQISNKYDLAVFSCKGMSVTAARELVDRTCVEYELPLFIMHDLDISGFSIKTTLHTSNRRYTLETEKDIETVDIGLRLTDLEYFAEHDESLEPEPVFFKVSDEEGHEHVAKETRRETLRNNGATEEEIAFLMADDVEGAGPNQGQRVELNAMTSRQFIDLIERKLAAHGVKKIVPEKGQLEKAYRLFVRNARVKEVVEAAIDAMTETPIEVPADLDEQVHEVLEEHPALSWDKAVRKVLEG